MDITHVSTHTQQTIEIEEPWKIVTRKSKGKQVAFEAARVVTFNSGDDSGRPNPYLS